MRGMRFFSAFLKVNPYFTVVMAVGFTGIAAIGVKHSDTVSLKNLIPLHIKSIFSDAPPDQIVAKVPDIENAQQLIHELSLWSAGPVDLSQGRSEQFSVLPPVLPPRPWQDPVLVGLGDPSGQRPLDIVANQPAIKTDTPFADSPYSMIPTPPAPISVPSMNASRASFVIPPSVAPLPAPLSFVPPLTITPLVVPPVVLVTLPSFPPGPPTPPTVQDPDPPVVTTEPPIGFLFAGMLAVLVGLRRRATRQGATVIAP